MYLMSVDWREEGGGRGRERKRRRREGGKGRGEGRRGRKTGWRRGKKGITSILETKLSILK